MLEKQEEAKATYANVGAELKKIYPVLTDEALETLEATVEGSFISPVTVLPLSMTVTLNRVILKRQMKDGSSVTQMTWLFRLCPFSIDCTFTV